MFRQKSHFSISIPYYGVAILWLLSLILHQSGRIALMMGGSIALFLLLRLLAPYSKPQVQANSAESELHPSSNDRSEQLRQKCSVAVQTLGHMAQQIQSVEVRETVVQLEDLSRKILNEVTECPEKTGKISTFVNYYVPTTLNILNAYRRTEATGIEGENINETKKQIESVLDSSILVVFHRQLDSLFGADALDISVELSVLKEMIIREGINSEKLECETTKNADGSDIRLTL